MLGIHSDFPGSPAMTPRTERSLMRLQMTRALSSIDEILDWAPAPPCLRSVASTFD